MLTQRQKEVLQLIIELYSRFEEPIGSKTLLKESYLTVSPATIRNDMVALEQEGFLNKAHSSSGRIPSNEGYRYYVQGLMYTQDAPTFKHEDLLAVERLMAEDYYDPSQLGQLVLEMLVEHSGYSGFILRQNNERHYFEELKLVPISGNRVIAMLVVDSGRLDHQIIDLPMALSLEEIDKVNQLINEELKGSLLEEAYQRLKLSIPLQIQRLIGYQIDVSDLVEQTLRQLKTHQYRVIGKLNLFELMETQLSVSAMKHLFQLIDGSKELYDLIEQGKNGVNVLFGFEFAPQTLANISIVYVKFNYGHQRICIGLVGPSTMHYDRVISIMQQMTAKFMN
ncbi:heat-inducible transcriptional repressor HrcA [Ignavigranum ruoffiae]|uniref:heat-inducible transcriptional repressor HrcA n=1 Tax=Ignavigranum ruoffiae TaxID=89093 RepID=UPI0024AE8469|nr:heat-inducible transcriptional repressor HrcA [Ignavigranum ruoffiae]